MNGINIKLAQACESEVLGIRGLPPHLNTRSITSVTQPRVRSLQKIFLVNDFSRSVSASIESKVCDARMRHRGRGCPAIRPLLSSCSQSMLFGGAQTRSSRQHHLQGSPHHNVSAHSWVRTVSSSIGELFGSMHLSFLWVDRRIRNAQRLRIFGNALCLATRRAISDRSKAIFLVFSRGSLH
ncbi:hypothetical protein BDV96DRAFT_600025 [Lophiotrema nucula]|uniref:Uncharacterized protein n=1 Tax=Lophiotrema nucula TaxID=690887 RepID=A0A6A5Z699_9PLEO|nr:hypothetical protein BDV96DRAFT_600025 [Lophiotrema nucula]